MTPKPPAVTKPDYIFKWGTSPQLGAINSKGQYRWLSWTEWSRMGFPKFADRANEGFIKLSWDANIAKMTDLRNSKGKVISYAEWKKENFPSPLVKTRFAGDQVYKLPYSPVVFYSGPTVHRAISWAEWRTMGFPAPRVILGK